ncbi:ataxin-1-like [Nerophis lumbriciformis]|uniref:ataxin-1-like n=1 Tax=Nerophis lumbriciformis TaxID=546530 RepID=UPI002AE01184|nr:ataxin-1-like [Nerophis lumbriciformis]XP_061820048.1 ataxin-1-like [Nerophis lumbriciformis]
MKPAQERNQECLPPKKRDLPVSNCGGSAGTAGVGLALGGVGGGGGGVSSGVGEDEMGSIQNSAAISDSQTCPPSGEWLRAQPGPHFGMDTSESIPAVPVDQYSMLYKVAVPSVTYSPTSPHPVLSHISPAYTVHSPLLQHPGLPYPPLGYAQLPHSSLQFVSSPYGALPYALTPGFVPGSLISPSGGIPQAHLVPYQSVIQEGVVSPPPQAQVAAHTFPKVSAPGGVPLMLPSEQTTQQHLGAVGVLSASELSLRGMPVFYHPQGAARAATTTTTPCRDPHSGVQEKEPEMNGRDKDQAAREVAPDYHGRNARLQQGAAISAAHESNQLRRLSSPGQRSTPDSDLEVQQMVGSWISSQNSAAGRKEVSFAPLNLSQSVQRARDVHVENTSGRAAYVAQPVSYSDPRVTNLQQHQQAGQPAHAVMLANGQPVLIPVEYHPQQHYSAQDHDGSPKPSFKVSGPSSRACLPERDVSKPTAAQPPQPAVQLPSEVTQALSSGTVLAPAPNSPSHFMKGAIIQLATGELKRVEDLQTQDFVRSAELSGGLKIDYSMVVDIHASQQRPGLVTLHFTVGEQKSKVTIDVPPEHPFFVFGQGWSSHSPERTTQLYGLACHQMQVGDMCVSITLQQPPQQQKAAQHNHPQQQNLSRTLSKTSTTSEPTHQLMGPPAPQQSRPQTHFRIERTHRDRPREADRDNKEEATHPEPPVRPSRTSGEHAKSQSGYQLHTDASAFTDAAMGAMHRRWSSPGLQRYNMKGDTGPQISTSGHIRPSFIPQEVKLSIEGRSNAGK